MGKSLSSIISDLNELVGDLERIDDLGMESIEEDGDITGVAECLELGLPGIIEKYDYNSNEAAAVRRLVEKWS